MNTLGAEDALAAIGAAPVVEAIGLALIHFSWQGFLLGSLLSLTLIALRERSPNVRYLVCLSTMVLMLAAPLVTTVLILSGIPRPLQAATESVLLLRERNPGTGWIAPLLPWLTAFWALGTSFLQVRLIVDWIGTRRLQRTGVRLLPETWLHDLHELRSRLGIRRAVEILESSLVRVPSVIGWSRPVILVPVGILSRLTPPQLRAVIAHELAHVRRHDYLVNLIQNVFESVLFFHPVTWWVSGRLRAEREYCCDDIAIAICGSSLRYAQALSSLDEFRGLTTQGALASTGGDLMQRISRMLESHTTTSVSRASWLPPLLSLAVVVALAAVITAGCSSDDRNDGGVGAAIAAPMAATEEPVYSVADQSLLRVVPRLEDYREAGLLTAEQVQECLDELGQAAGEGTAVCDVSGDGNVVCRIVVCDPGESASASCCPTGAQVIRLRPGETLEDCVRRAMQSSTQP